MNKLLLFVIFVVALAQYKSYEGTQVLKFKLNSVDQVKDLERFEQSGKVDFWSESPNGEYEVSIPQEMKQVFEKNFIQRHHIKYEVIIQNLQEKINQEMEEMKKVPTFSPSKDNTETIFDKFRTVAEINVWLQNKATTNPQFVQLATVGKSYEKRDIFGVKIHNKSTRAKGSVLIHGAIHAREWIAPSTVLWIANELLTKYNTDPIVKKLVDNLEFHVFPVLNVDGYEFTHTRDRMWRKTRRPNPGSSCIGTDPNRNFAYKWNTGGSSRDPCSQTFHGSAPFSEVESKQIASYGKNLTNLLGYIDYHAYGQLVMRPYGWSRNDSPDEAKLRKIGDDVATTITRVRGKSYRSGKFATILYVGSGTSIDNFYDAQGVNAYCIELGTSFVMPISEIKPIGTENFEGFKKFALALLEL